MNNFFAHTGAFGLGSDIADSACIRLNTSCIADVDYVVERNFCEGGYIPVQAVSSNSNDHDKGGNYLIDKMIIAHTAGTVGVSIQTGRGMTIRNVAAYMPDTLYRYFGGSGVQRSLVSIKPTGTVAGNADEPLTIHNCTLLSDQSQANEYSTSGSILEYFVMQVEDISASESFTAITEVNNVVQNADSAKPSTAAAPIDTSVNFSGITPDYAGKRWDYEHVSITVASTTTNIGESFVVAYSDIGSTTVGGVDVAGTTDQAYWQALPAENDSHQLRIDGNSYSSEGGDFTVAYEAGGVRFTNTSTRNWTSYTDFTFKLDRHTAIPAMDTSQANPANVPIPRILTGSLTAAQTASSGLVAYDDLLGAVRSGTKVKGAVALV